jgi:hypothetical protein
MSPEFSLTLACLPPSVMSCISVFCSDVYSTGILDYLSFKGENIFLENKER